MTELEPMLWEGESGQKYIYYINRIGAVFASEPGNYIFVKEKRPNSWTPIYAGETDNLNERLTEDYEKMQCIKKHGATHIHVHGIISDKYNDESKRRKEVSDIVKKWKPLCNSED